MGNPQIDQDPEFVTTDDLATKLICLAICNFFKGSTECPSVACCPQPICYRFRGALLCVNPSETRKVRARNTDFMTLPKGGVVLTTVLRRRRMIAGPNFLYCPLITSQPSCYTSAANFRFRPRYFPPQVQPCKSRHWMKNLQGRLRPDSVEKVGV